MPVKVKESGFYYTEYLTALDDTAIILSKQRFESLREKNVILNDSFEDMVWVMTNEVVTLQLDFSNGIDEILFEHVCREKLGITLQQYQLSIKVFVTAYFGASISALQQIVCGCKHILNYASGKCSLSRLAKNASFLSDFVETLPSNTPYWEHLVDSIECMETSYEESGQRKLGTYRSYFRFDRIITEFWAKASDNDKTFFFPVFFWWKLTSILPLRPTEFVLIPRNCLEQYDTGYYLTIRRTKLKGEKLMAEYRIDKDYEIHRYQIPAMLAHEIQSYITKTEPYVNSDIGTLLCQRYQYKRLGLIKSNNSPHYTYDNLRQCLSYFYEDIVHKSNSLLVIEKASDFGEHTLMENEIERINLGDTRHISMINLIASGGNPVICKELAGHTDINISSNYYSNLQTFIEAMSFERYFDSAFAVVPVASTEISTNMPALNDGGHCSSSLVAKGEYSDCMSAINPEGHLLSCRYCKYYIAPVHGKYNVDIKSLIRSETKTEERLLKSSFDNLMHTIELVRKGLGCENDIQSVLLKLQASANQYSYAIFRIYKGAM